MGKNPFDRYPSPVSHAKTYATAQASAQVAVEECDAQRAAHRTAWATHKQEHHARRLEQALEQEENDPRFVPTLIREQWNAEDDDRFAYLTQFDQLLELRDHEEYLRGRRAWERRHKVEDVELNVTILPELQQMTGIQIWAAIVTVFMAVLFGAGLLASGPGILLLSPVLLLFWVGLVRLPLIYSGTFSSSGGGSRGAPGNAV